MRILEKAYGAPGEAHGTLSYASAGTRQTKLFLAEPGVVVERYGCGTQVNLAPRRIRVNDNV
jgi:hypothetical protein